jgi:hypothetical protein
MKSVDWCVLALLPLAACGQAPGLDANGQEVVAARDTAVLTGKWERGNSLNRNVWTFDGNKYISDFPTQNFKLSGTFTLADSTIALRRESVSVGEPAAIAVTQVLPYYLKGDKLILSGLTRTKPGDGLVGVWRMVDQRTGDKFGYRATTTYEYTFMPDGKLTIHQFSDASSDLLNQIYPTDEAKRKVGVIQDFTYAATYAQPDANGQIHIERLPGRETIELFDNAVLITDKSAKLTRSP